MNNEITVETIFISGNLVKQLCVECTTGMADGTAEWVAGSMHTDQVSVVDTTASLSEE